VHPRSRGPFLHQEVSADPVAGGVLVSRPRLVHPLSALAAQRCISIDTRLPIVFLGPDEEHYLPGSDFGRRREPTGNSSWPDSLLEIRCDSFRERAQPLHGLRSELRAPGAGRNRLELQATNNVPVNVAQEYHRREEQGHDTPPAGDGSEQRVVPEYAMNAALAEGGGTSHRKAEDNTSNHRHKPDGPRRCLSVAVLTDHDWAPGSMANDPPERAHAGRNGVPQENVHRVVGALQHLPRLPLYRHRKPSPCLTLAHHEPGD
jgi:hypothetical protein